MRDFKLTQRQREFAAEHHKVLENFLRYKGLPQEEFYDVVVFRYLLAVKQYDEREDLRQYQFSTIAKHHMRSALSNYFSKQKRERENFDMLSLDYSLPSNPNLTVSDIIADKNVNVCEEVCERLSREPNTVRLYPVSPFAEAEYPLAA